MVKRRSMADAFSSDQMAFVRGGATNEAGRGHEKPKAHEERVPLAEAAQPEQETPRVATVRRGRKPKALTPVAQPAPAYEEMGSYEGYLPILVSLTTRLSPATAESLRRAALELRLRRRKPHTQQEIVEAAVRTWLKTNGFLQAA